MTRAELPTVVAKVRFALVPEWETVKRLLLMSPDEIQAAIQASHEFAESVEFEETIDPKKSGSEYDWLSEYAKAKFERAERIYKELDEKANDIIKYLGGGTGLFALLAISNVTHRNFWVVGFAIPSFFLAIISIALAASVRRPNPALEPLSIRKAYKYVDKCKDGEPSKVLFLGQWDLACTGMFLVVKDKAKRVELATQYYVRAIASLAVPLIVAIGLAIYGS